MSISAKVALLFFSEVYATATKWKSSEACNVWNRCEALKKIRKAANSL